MKRCLTLILLTTTIVVVCSSAYRFHSRIRVKNKGYCGLKFNTIKVPDCKTLNLNNNTIQKFDNRKFIGLNNRIVY